MRETLPRRLLTRIAGLRRWLRYRPERAYMRGR